MSREKKISRKVTLWFFIGAICCLSGLASAEELEERTLSGIFQSASEDGREVSLLFTHPATGESEVMSFGLTKQTGFSGFEDLSELDEWDALQVDYFETAGHGRFLKRLSRVQLFGAPKGLEGFDKKRLLQKDKE